MRKLLVGGTVALASVVGVAAPAFAHDCFNPNKPIGAGSVGTVTIDPNNPDAAPVPNGKNGGGFLTIDATALGAGVYDVHVFGGHNDGTTGGPKSGVVGGPGSQRPEHACDGKGIDYIDACNPQLADG
jgi:hypothetical protein